MNKNFKIHFTKLSQWLDPEQVFATLFANEPHSFWLDSSLTNKENRFSYMGGSPKEIYSYFLKNSRIVMQTEKKIKQLNQDIFTFLNEKLAQQTHSNSTLPFPFIGGFVGYFGYELKVLTEKIESSYESSYPDSLWYFVDKFIAFDHQEKHMYLVAATEKREAEEWFEKITQVISSERKERSNLIKKNVTSSQTLHEEKNNFHLARNHHQYLNDIKACKDYLSVGESYQICLTNTITAKTKTDPFLLYQTLRKTNPAPYAAYFKYNNLSILCSSPEQFLAIEKNRTVQTKPIKGTIRRGKTPEEDKQLAKQLTDSKKDWSENAMIVDLLRNDLGKVCTFGSVKVKKLMNIESYETVHQLVSTVTGQLNDEVSMIDCIKACFPGGSMTGAPKKRTMEILETLEKKARGIYSGALGFLSFNQTMKLNIVIRTIIIDGEKVEIGAGGAILFDSDPEKEYDEMLLKAKALMEALNKSPLP